MTRDERCKVLDSIDQIKSVAEDGNSINLEDFLVMPEYGRLREPNRFLILGGRGSGKTQVFRTLTQTADGFAKLVGDQQQLMGPSASNTHVITGYNLDGNFP